MLKAVQPWLAFLLGLGPASGAPSTFLDPQGPVAAAQRHLFFDVIAWMMIVIVPVFVLVPWFAWRYRRKAGTTSRPDWSFSGPLEAVIWGVPIAVVSILAVLIWSKERALDPYAPLASDKPPLEVEVIGLDWKWLFIYPEYHIATVGVLAFPSDRPLHLRLTSDTVMQSFFIPSLGSQIYAMAGMITQLNLAADGPGESRGENTQFNGMGFQSQKFDAVAMSSQDFSGWVSQVKSAGKPLNQQAYHILSQKTSAESAQRQFGMNKLPPRVLYFSDVALAFFNEVVGKYHPVMTPDAPPAGQKQTKGHA